MGDIEELKELVIKQSRENIAAQMRVDDLIAALVQARAAPAHAPGLDPGTAAAAGVAAQA